ncbi:hypothetical protein ACWGB8_27290 [Kitasatospora sp. NPDC054939]
MSMPRPGYGPDDETFRYDGGGARPGPPPHRGAEPDDDPASATFLDPTVWSSGGPTAPYGPPGVDPAATVPAPGPGPVADRAPEIPPGSAAAGPPAGPGEVRRFGPGVPPRAAAAWHGAAPPPEPEHRRSRRALRWLVPAAVLLALLALLDRCRAEPPLAVTGVAVTVDPAAGPGCGGTAVLTAAVATNGRAGTVRYRWLRSDGTASGELSQPVRAGQRRVDVVLRWTFDGPGTMRATATVEVRSPQPHSAAASFTYTCRR